MERPTQSRDLIAHSDAAVADVESGRVQQATSSFAPGTGSATQFSNEAQGMVWLGRAPANAQAVGFSDDRHLITIAGGRSGKGTSVIIPNLLEYRGSLLCIDPKGENATVTARRRANGSPFAFGIGQRVVVLDPFGVADVPDDLRGSLNPLDLVNLADVSAIDEARTIAEALVVLDDPKEMHWAESAKQLIAALVLFVKVLDRPALVHLAYVRHLLTRGLAAADVGVEPTQPPMSGTELLLKVMQQCEECGGVIAAAAQTLLDMGTEERGSVLSFARRNTAFLDSPRMQRCLDSSTFSLADLKTLRGGLSVYLCLPVRELQNHGRWLRLVVMLGLVEMERLGHPPSVTGHPVLFLLDEFASLGYMKPVEVAAAYIAGYGVKLWLVVQDLGQLKALYEKSWATFLGNAGVLQCFANSDQPTLEYLSKRLGDSELRQVTRTTSQSRSWTQSQSVSESSTAGTSQTSSKDLSVARQPRGIFFLGKRTGESRGTGTSSSSDMSKTQGTSHDNSQTQGSESGFAESIVVVPLRRPDEIEREFSKDSAQQLLVVAGDRPVVLHRTDYFDDPQFDSKFDPHPAHLDKAPLTLEEKERRAREALHRRLELAEAERQQATDEVERLRQRPASTAAMVAWRRGLIGAGVVASILLLNRLSNKESAPQAQSIAAPDATAPAPASADRRFAANVAPPPSPVPVPVAASSSLPSTLSVAAVGANLRSDASERGTVLAQLARGDALQVLAASNGFYRVRTASAVEGWVAERVVIEPAHIARLQALAPNVYLTAERPRLDAALSQFRELRAEVDSVYAQMTQGAPGAVERLQTLDLRSRIVTQPDTAASRWYGLSAEFAEKSKNYQEAADNAIAAFAADPTSGEHMHRYLVAQHQLGNVDAVRSLAVVAVMLAPTATNSWLMMGIAQASLDSPDAATTAFRTALRFSRSLPNTQQYFQKLAAEASDARLTSALNNALANP
jgi:type IV secretion system protein VirD4